MLDNNWIQVTKFLTFKGIVQRFENYVYWLSCWELDEKIDITLISVHEATARSRLA